MSGCLGANGVGNGGSSVASTSSSSSSSSNFITLLASTTLPQTAGPAAQRLLLRIPRIHAYYTGTGAGYVALGSHTMVLLDSRCSAYLARIVAAGALGCCRHGIADVVQLAAEGSRVTTWVSVGCGCLQVT